MNETHRFIVGGYGRAYSAAAEKIRLEVQAEFAEQLDQSSGLAKLRLKREITREINRRIHRIAPPDALY